jgi:cobaltochelatase CobN
MFSNLLKTVDMVTQERDRTEYEVTDLDHYYEFFGGLARSVEDKKGQKVDMLIVDGAADELAVDDAATTITRATRTRMLNPRWLDGMLNHDFHGAQQIKDRMENLLGFAATTDAVENYLFDDIADRLIFDDEMRQKIEKNNLYAAMKIAETLIESHNRGYWEADKEKIKKLRDITLAMEGEIE